MIYKLKIKQDFIATAREVAWKNRGHHDYLPMNPATFGRWNPHAWVIESMEKAYNQGLEDCKKVCDKGAE